ncbi:AraC family transcriptional regulator [Rhodoferax sp.]|uniref:AraC family transcriptional regulator n=1 Tax=Rhodoferax sp. TaxID=50421 RepID=UPI0025E1D7D0|nr:AraC family transcriptional regulator [Rhodoferax sp.]
MPTSIGSDTPRLDRLSALLLAVTPRVSILYPQGEGANTLWISLMAVPGGSAPHSVVIAPSHGTSMTGVAFQVHLEGPAAPLLMREFAQPLVLKLVDADVALQLAVQVLWTESVSPRCGQPAMLTHAGNMLFIGLLRHLVAHPKADIGLFSGLSDPRIAKALVAIHAHPQLGWSLETLAEHAGMSRTLFATHFKSTMGTSPGKYLTQVRLLVAQRAVQSGKGLKGAASQSGYKDVSALSRALGRHARTLNRQLIHPSEKH